MLQIDRTIDDPLVERSLGEKDAVLHAPFYAKGYTSRLAMRVLDAVAHVVQLGGAAAHRGRVAEMRALFEAKTGAFAPEDEWFEERSRAFWCDAVTRGRFGREVADELDEGERKWLAPLERAHRGLFHSLSPIPRFARAAGENHAGDLFVDVWSGAEILVTVVDDESRAELVAAAGQLFDARVVGWIDDHPGPDEGPVIALLPGSVFHPRDATAAIESVLAAARERSLPTHEVLDALLRMQRTLRSLARVKAAFAYRADALTLRAPAPPMRRAAKAPT